MTSNAPSTLALQGCDAAVREDLLDAHRRAWQAIASPGTWLDGVRRLAVAREVRQAREHCATCRAMKAALSPNGFRDRHESLGELAAPEIELVHRLVCDSGRLGETWARGLVDEGLDEGVYVEIVGLVAMVMMLDTCTLALGLPDQTLPLPIAGPPSRYRPPGARRRAAWLPITEPEDAVEADGPMYPNPRAGYIYRGLSLVPQSLRDDWAMANCHYLPGAFVYRFDHSMRAISRPQTEIIAARTSALHQCAY